MASNVSVSELCSGESSADRMLANGSMSTVSTPLADSCQVFDLPLIGSDLTRITADLFANIPTVDSGSVTTIIDINGLTGGSDFDATNQMTLFPANDPNMSQSLLASNIFATAAESIGFDLQNNSSNVIQLSSDTIETKSSQIGYKRVFERKPKSLVKKSRKPLTTQIIAVYEDNGEEAITDSTSDYTKSGTLLKCNYCSHECHRLQEMRRHLKPHMEDKPFKCEECDQTFNVEVNLRLHICGQHYKTTDSKPMCCECDKRFTRLASLKSHLTVHQKEELLSCGQCCQQFPTHYYLNKHINSDHLNVQKKVKASDKVSLPKPEHVCGVCSQKFVNNSLLKEHQKLHLKINSSLKHKTFKKWIDRSDFHHKCNTCGKTFKKNCQLVRHNRIHSGEKPFVCEFCSTAFNQKSSLDIHRTKHTGERKHECKFCGAQFNQSGNMRSHIRRLHAPQADTPLSQLFRCPFCSCVFKKLGILNGHISRRHPLEANEASIIQNTDLVTNESSTSRLDAPIDERLSDLLSKALERSGVKNDEAVERCGLQQIAQLFDPATGSRQTHIVRRVGNVSYRQCLYCHKEFKKSSDLIRHYRIHTHDKPFKCSQCFRAFTVKGTLSAHMRTHNGLKPYVCQLCDRRFSTSQSLKVHVRLHTGALPYHCQHCDKSFRTLGHLKTHSSLHARQNHSAADNPILVANKIRRKDIDQSLLERIQLDGPLLLVNSTDESEAQNESNCEQNSLKPDAKRKHKCCHCGKGFKKNSHLTQHIRSHTGEKPYQCDQCLQCFVAKSSLKIHMQIHSKVKPFECSECQFAFATRGSLTRHMLRHSSDRPFMCPYCAKTFKSSLNCKKHLKLHRTEFAIQLMSEQSKQNESQKENQISENIVSVSDDSPKVVSLLDKSLEQTTLTEANVQSNDIFTNIDCNLSSVGNQSDGQTAINPTTDQTMQTIESQVVEPVLHTFVTLADSSRPFPCQVCGLAFKKSSHLKQHERRHTGERPFKCEICGREFATRGVLTNHLNTHSSTKNFRCDICNSNFVTNNSLRRHLRTVHTFYTCPHCAVKCKSRSALEKHFESVHNLVIQTMEPVMESTEPANNELIFDSCPPMDTTADAMVGLESIDQKVDENGDNQTKALRLNQCEFCPKIFKKPSDLQRHRRIHTGEKPYNCHICAKSFTVKSTLDCHLIAHKGLKNFKCEICGTAFATSGSLKVHNRLHTGQKPFECDLCGERFRTSGHRKAHIDKHNKSKAGPQIEATSVPQSNALVKASVATEELIAPIELNPSLGSDVLQIAVPAIGGQSELFSQLFQIDASLIQQLQSQGFVITETDGIDIIGEPITAITTTLF